MPECVIIKLLPTLRLYCQTTNFFPSHFASIRSCSAFLGEIKTQICTSKLRPNSIQSNEQQEIGAEEMPQTVKVHLTSRAEKALCQGNK